MNHKDIAFKTEYLSHYTLSTIAKAQMAAAAYEAKHRRYTSAAWLIEEVAKEVLGDTRPDGWALPPPIG